MWFAADIELKHGRLRFHSFGLFMAIVGVLFVVAGSVLLYAMVSVSSLTMLMGLGVLIGLLGLATTEVMRRKCCRWDMAASELEVSQVPVHEWPSSFPAGKVLIEMVVAGRKKPLYMVLDAEDLPVFFDSMRHA